MLTYKEFLNESIRDMMTPKSMDDFSPEGLLFYAIEYGQLELVPIAIQKGAKGNVGGEETEKGGVEGDTALLRALENGYTEVAQTLIENGADLEAKNAGEFTLLIWAAWRGEPGIVEMLIENGANLEATDDYGMTALINASLEGHTEVVEILVKNGANVNAKTTSGFTSLMVATKDNRTDIVEILKKHGAKE